MRAVSPVGAAPLPLLRDTCRADRARCGRGGPALFPGGKRERGRVRREQNKPPRPSRAEPTTWETAPGSRCAIASRHLLHALKRPDVEQSDVNKLARTVACSGDVSNKALDTLVAGRRPGLRNKWPAANCQLLAGPTGSGPAAATAASRPTEAERASERPLAGRPLCKPPVALAPTGGQEIGRPPRTGRSSPRAAHRRATSTRAKCQERISLAK